MIANEEAAWEIHHILLELKASYAIIGGMAVQYWVRRASQKIWI